MTTVSLRIWLRRLADCSKSGRRTTGHLYRLRSRPYLEVFETRCVPSTVTNLDDAGNGSLRQAIIDTPAGGIVDFQSGLSGTITLTSGELGIGRDLTITGPGADVITISGNHASTVFDIGGAFNPIVTISGLTISDGMNAGDALFPAGGISNTGSLTLVNCTLTDNAGYGRIQGFGGTGAGGAIFNNGTLALAYCTVSRNYASSIHSTAGGGIYNGYQAAALSVTSCTFSDNSAEAITAPAGGAIAADLGSVTVTNSTVSANSAGGIFSGQGVLLTVTNSTISGNSGLGVGGAGMRLGNTIVAGNSSDVAGTLASQGHNLIGDGTGGSGYDPTDLVGTADHPIDPKLGPLGDNGGPTQTMALLADSPAIDAGNDVLSADPWDQRGPDYERIGNAVIDIGAFEVQVARSFVVTNANDAGSGSLREAIAAANMHSGDNAITFNISGGGVHTIHLTSPLPTIIQPVLIDGATEPRSGASPSIVLSGAGAGAGATGLTIAGGNSYVRGLVINGFAGAGILLQGNGRDFILGDYIGTDVSGMRPVGNQVGILIDGISNNMIGTGIGDGNVISGNRDAGVAILGSGNRLEGNRIGTDFSGSTPLPNRTGVFVSDMGSNNSIGGNTTGAGNLISGNREDGVTISGNHNVVEGNRIGTDLSGGVAVPNRTGVSIVYVGSNNTIGGNQRAAANLISGNRLDGIGMYGGSQNRVLGNRIGTDASATRAIPNRYGIELFSGSAASVIGGTDPGAGNVIGGNRLDAVGIYSNGNLLQGNFIGAYRVSIGNGRNGVAIHAFEYGFNNTILGGATAGAANSIAYNGHDGVLVDRGTGNAIQENSIFANGHLGIELRHQGNENQAAPVLNSALSAASTTTVAGTLVSAPNTIFTVELFTNPDSGIAEGQGFLGSIMVATDGSGHGSFTAMLPVGLGLGQLVTATATDPAGNTSQFSEGVVVTGTANYTPLNVPGAEDTYANGINASGQIVGGYQYGDGNAHGFLLSDGTYTTVDVTGSTWTVPTGINDSGQIVGWYIDVNGNIRGFLLIGGTYTSVDAPGATDTEPSGINDSGQIVGRYFDANGNTHGFVLSGGIYSTLDAPGATYTAALGINGLGQIVGTYSDAGGNHGFLLSGDVYMALDVPGSTVTNAAGINDNGQIVGNYQTPSGGNYGFVWSGGSYTTLQVPGADITSSNGINNSGQIVGYSESGITIEGFLATLTNPGSPRMASADRTTGGRLAGVTPLGAEPRAPLSTAGMRAPDSVDPYFAGDVTALETPTAGWWSPRLRAFADGTLDSMFGGDAASQEWI
jgi:probable HAF family extracellular repeat protein